MTHGLGPVKPGPRATKPITPLYVENNYRIEVKYTFVLIAYLVLLCEFFEEFSIFHFCRPQVDVYWHPLLSTRRSWYYGRQPEVFLQHDSHRACQDVLELRSRTSKREFWNQRFRKFTNVSINKAKFVNIWCPIYREYFMESAGVRYLRTSCWRIRNRTSERNERVRFLIQKQRVRKYRTKNFLCGIVFIIYILYYLQSLHQFIKFDLVSK